MGGGELGPGDHDNPTLPHVPYGTGLAVASLLGLVGHDGAGLGLSWVTFGLSWVLVGLLRLGGHREPHTSHGGASIGKRSPGPQGPV